MDAQRLTELLEPFVSAPLSTRQTEQLLAYLELLLKWNTKMNLTAVRNPEHIVTRHFGESLFAASHLAKIPFATAADVGSGAGFPGLPIAIYAPDCKLTLIESQNKKATFLREAVRVLGLSNVNVANTRAADLKTQAELVTMRAVEKFEQSAVEAQRLVAPGGRLAMLIGAAQVDTAKQLLQLDLAEPVAIPQSNARVLLVGKAKPQMNAEQRR